MPVTISGTTEELLLKAEAVKEVTTRRREFGWILFQIDEDWDYRPIYDINLCPICESFGGDMRGPQIPVEFKEWKREHPLQQLEKNEVYPNTHESFPSFGLKGTCRCVLRWDDYLYVLTNRLMSEIEEVTL